MTENEFDQDVDAQVKQFRDHDEQVDRLNARILLLENHTLKQANELADLLMKERQWNAVLNQVGFNLGRLDPMSFEPGGDLNEHVAMIAVPRMVQLIRLGEHFEALIRAAETNEITRSHLQQLAMTIKLADVTASGDDAA